MLENTASHAILLLLSSLVYFYNNLIAEKFLKIKKLFKNTTSGLVCTTLTILTLRSLLFCYNKNSTTIYCQNSLIYNKLLQKNMLVFLFFMHYIDLMLKKTCFTSACFSFGSLSFFFFGLST